MQSQEVDKAKEIEEEVDRIEETTIIVDKETEEEVDNIEEITTIMDKVIEVTISIKETTIIMDKEDKIIKITTAIKEKMVDKVDISQEIRQDNSITYTVGYVNKMDTIPYSGVQSSQNTFLEEVMPRVSHG